MPVPLAVRFERQVDRSGPNGCWLWTGTTRRGYGRIRDEPPTYRALTASRVAYELYVGPIPEGMVIDHLCDNPTCVNPEHLEAVTQSVNLQRRVDRRTGVCRRGHPFDGERREGGYVVRFCRTCRRDQERARREAARAVPRG